MLFSNISYWDAYETEHSEVHHSAEHSLNEAAQGDELRVLVDHDQSEEGLEDHTNGPNDDLPARTTVESNAEDRVQNHYLLHGSWGHRVEGHMKEQVVHQIDNDAEMDQVTPFVYSDIQ